MPWSPARDPWFVCVQGSSCSVPHSSAVSPGSAVQCLDPASLCHIRCHSSPVLVILTVVRALVQCSFHSRQCPSSILVSGALPQCPSPTTVWFAPEVGLASGLGSGSALPSGRSRPQSQLRFQLQYQSQSPRQSPRSLRDSGDTRHGWDPGPLRQYHRGDPGGPGPSSGPVLPDRVSHHPLGPSRPLHQQQR